MLSAGCVTREELEAKRHPEQAVKQEQSAEESWYAKAGTGVIIGHERPRPEYRDREMVAYAYPVTEKTLDWCHNVVPKGFIVHPKIAFQNNWLTKVDESGQFRLNGLAGGEYFVVTQTWPAEGVSLGAPDRFLSRGVVRVVEGEVVEVVLSPLLSFQDKRP